MVKPNNSPEAQLPDNLTKAELKEVFKEALTEWLDKRYAEFGRWSLLAILAAGLAGLAYLALLSDGWRK